MDNLFFFPQVRWKIPEYTKRQINDAGEVIRNPNAKEDKKKEALAIVDNWRAAHAYPMHVFYMNLRGKAKSRSDILVAERLKRLDSIIKKLQLQTSMQLYRMQDLGGCRMIVPSIDEVYGFSSKIQTPRIRHVLKKTDDYIKEPKLSGYRSLHLIYQFRSDTPGKEIYNSYPMLIELQFRTHLQHIWATAVETKGLFINQALKSGQGDESIKRFFAVVSSLFALKEGAPVVPGTVADEAELISEIEQINNRYHILDTISAIKIAFNRGDNHIAKQHGYYILQLNYEEKIVTMWPFMPSEIESAALMYEKLEQEKEDKPLDTVLIRASSFSAVKSAYPNYFMDITEFVDLVFDYLR